MSDNTSSKTLLLILGLTLVLGVGVWYKMSDPSPGSIIQNMKVNEQSIVYDGETYAAEWSKEVSVFEGKARAILSQFNALAPFNTHILMLTTGDFSNPEIVGLKNGKVFIQPNAPLKDKPKGSINVLHVVASNERLFYKIKRLKENQNLKISGRLEMDGKVTNSKGKYIQYGNKKKGRILIMVDEIEVIS